MAVMINFIWSDRSCCCCNRSIVLVVVVVVGNINTYLCNHHVVLTINEISCSGELTIIVSVVPGRFVELCLFGLLRKLKEIIQLSLSLFLVENVSYIDAPLNLRRQQQQQLCSSFDETNIPRRTFVDFFYFPL